MGLDLAKTQTTRVHIVLTNELSPLPPDEMLAVNAISHKYALEQNHPNPLTPLSPLSSLNSFCRRQDYVTLKVYNLLEQEVATLVNETKSSVIYTVN